jgi:integrase
VSFAEKRCSRIFFEIFAFMRETNVPETYPSFGNGTFFALLVANEIDNTNDAIGQQECPGSSPDAFIFPDSKGGFMDTGNYRKRVLHKLARDLGLPKLTFQVIRRTIATLAQKKGTVKDVQGLLRHSRAATTTDVYMQEIPESVQGTINAIHSELRLKPETAQAG